MSWTLPRTWVAAERVTAALMNAHVRDNQQAGPIADTITNLNALVTSKADGCPGVIKVGATPYDLVELRWNGTTSKWVETDADMVAYATQSVATVGTTFTVPAVPGPLMRHKIFTDAGLKLQMKLITVLTAGASSTIQAAVLASTGDNTGALTLDTANPQITISTTSTSPVLVESSWTDWTTITAKDFVAVHIAVRRSAGANNGSLGVSSALWTRWST